ncbi:MAG: hypothetical protein WAV54_02710 [Acidimicrobiales bacterium]
MERHFCHAVALSFFYRIVRRVVEILCVHHMDALAKDAGIHLLRQLAKEYETSEQMARFRLNASGVLVQVGMAKAARQKQARLSG